MNLKQLAKTGFRTKEVVVAEWGQAKVIIREPMHINFGQFAKEIKSIEDNKELSDLERNTLSIKAETKLFITILFDNDNKAVFTDADIDDLAKTYGPVHTRLLNQSIELTGLGNDPIKEAEKK